MAEESEISWTDATFNPWIGCTRVSPGCDHCYAARDNKLRKWVGDGDWGPGLRRRTSEGNWNQVRRWDRKAALASIRPRVFCASLADVFDNEVPDEWRADLFKLISETPHLRWMLLTKRIGNVERMLPAGFGPEAPWSHVGIMATMVNQLEWDRDIGKLMHVPAAWHGVSVEPMLGPIRIGRWRPDWIITGGESGFGYREFDPEWGAIMQAQCEMAGIAYHHKQNGGFRGKDRGCLINGREYKAFPPALAA